MFCFRWCFIGLLGTDADRKKDFFFGIISDGIHCHPATVRCLPSLFPQLFGTTHHMRADALACGLTCFLTTACTCA